MKKLCIIEWWLIFLSVTKVRGGEIEKIYKNDEASEMRSLKELDRLK